MLSKTSSPLTRPVAEALINRNPVFAAGGEFLAGHFLAQERLRRTPEGGYGRRPPIGLRLAVDDRRTLTCKPGWTPAKWRYAGGVNFLATPGTLHLGRVLIELVTPGIKLKLTLTEDGAKIGQWADYQGQSLHLADIKRVAETFRRLLNDPMRTFAEESETCCCCGRPLTDQTSRLRGVGPECVKYFGHADEVAKAVRQKYRSLDDEWWSD